MSTNLPRVHQKIFGETATNLEPIAIAQFGSVIAGTPNRTGDIEEIQALQNWEQGWTGSTITNRRYPTSEETTGINKVITQQLAYILQKGMPEWCEDTTYFQTSFCQYQGIMYHSLTDNNIGHLPTDTAYWEIYPAPDSLLLNTSMSNIAPLGIDRMNQSKALIVGNVASYSEELSQLKDMAHSTFDLSKFTVTGSPTITNGIASGFSSSDYVSLSLPEPITLNTTKMVVKISGTFETSTTGETFWSCGGTRLRINNNLIALWDTTSNKLCETSSTLQSGDAFEIVAIVDSTNGHQIIAYKNGIFMSSNTPVVSTATDSPRQAFNIGIWTTDTPGEFKGSIDLKQFSITVNGVEAFSGNKTGSDSYTINGSTVTIPYTLSKTGSKIVDSAYRTRVSAVYNEFGYAPYYTLSDTDFTLPMGELYGMIERNDKKTVDGQWVNSTITFAEDVTIQSDTVYEYSLSTYLPNDGFQYEVYVSMKTMSNTSTGNSAIANVWSDILPGISQNTAITMSYVNNTGSGRGQYSGSSAIIPVGSARKLYLKTTSVTAWTLVGFWAVGYRRIGTNM